MDSEQVGELRNKKIGTHCPSCGNQTLFLSDRGDLVCSWIGGRNEAGCKEPVVSRYIDDVQVQVAELQARRVLLQDDLRIAKERLDVAHAASDVKSRQMTELEQECDSLRRTLDGEPCNVDFQREAQRMSAYADKCLHDKETLERQLDQATAQVASHEAYHRDQMHEKNATIAGMVVQINALTATLIMDKAMFKELQQLRLFSQGTRTEIGVVEQERDQLKVQVDGYDSWLSKGVYFTNDEFTIHLTQHAAQVAANDVRMQHMSLEISDNVGQVKELMLQRDACSSEAEKAKQQVVIWKAHHANVVKSRHRGDLIKHQLLQAEKDKVVELERQLGQFRAQVEVGDKISGSFFEALKPLLLPSIQVGNPGQHVTDLIKQLYQARALLILAYDLIPGMQNGVVQPHYLLLQQMMTFIAPLGTITDADLAWARAQVNG